MLRFYFVQLNSPLDDVQQRHYFSSIVIQFTCSNTKTSTSLPLIQLRHNNLFLLSALWLEREVCSWVWVACLAFGGQPFPSRQTHRQATSKPDSSRPKHIKCPAQSSSPHICVNHHIMLSSWHPNPIWPIYTWTIINELTHTHTLCLPLLIYISNSQAHTDKCVHTRVAHFPRIRISGKAGNLLTLFNPSPHTHKHVKIQGRGLTG